MRLKDSGAIVPMWMDTPWLLPSHFHHCPSLTSMPCRVFARFSLIPTLLFKHSMDSPATSTTNLSSPTDSTGDEELAQSCTTPLPLNDQSQPDVQLLSRQESSQEPESETHLDVSLLSASSASSGIIPSATSTPNGEREKTEAVRPKPQKKWMKKPGGWFWELVTWLFGTLSILAIVLVLGLFNDKNVEQWKSSIRINTIVSILSQVAVSALMVSVSACVGQMKWVWYQAERSLIDIDIDRFDFASRGPLGSVMFLCSKRCVLQANVLGKCCLAHAKAGILRPWGLLPPSSCSAFNLSYNRLSTVCAGCDRRQPGEAAVEVQTQARAREPVGSLAMARCDGLCPIRL